SKDLEEQIETVNQLLEELGLGQIPTLMLANKIDLVTNETAQWLKKRYQAIAISARRSESLAPLLDEVVKTLNKNSPARALSLHRSESGSPSQEPAQDKLESPAEDQKKSFSPAQPH
ncbi:MAG: hypothetical protein U9N63_01430, partial [Pseudomonadota bacterium]|nr:hypothetical protein [Pseudomonadota bacterium]